MRFFIYTTGCKANQWDSYVMTNLLLEAGCSPASPEEADVIVVNGCALTEGAERDVRRFIGSALRQNPGARVVLTGCQGQVYPEKTFGAHTVLGQKEKFGIGEYVGRSGRFVSAERKRPMEKALIEGLPDGRTRFFFKIQDGCNRFCSYCVVPLGRGEPRSRPLGEVMETLARLAERGVKEVVLTGIELSSYLDEPSGSDLKSLLRTMEGELTPPRIRLSSIDPCYLDEEFMEIMARSGKIAKSLHIPLQSGCDRILGLMGRPYTAAFIEATVKQLNRRIEGVGIGLDVITGFPTESEEDFEETVALISSLDVYYLHVFPFSAREGTAAAAMEGKVAAAVKKQRVKALKALDGEKRMAFYKRFLGTDAWIIPEGKVYKGVYARGYTDNYLPVHIARKKVIENNMTKVKIMEIQGNMLIGDITGP